MPIYPSIEISKTARYLQNFEDVIEYTHFNCKNFEPDNTRLSKDKPSVCYACKNYMICDIRNQEFRIYIGGSRCPSCKLIILDNLYRYIMWKLRDYVPFSEMKCCYCKAAEERNIEDWTKVGIV